MSQPTEQRPPQVTLASSIVMFASVVVLLSAWERISTLGSLESQTAIAEFLAEAPFSSLGLDVSSGADVLRVLCMVAAVGACATGILGWFVRKPDRSARLGLSIFAVPVFVAGLAVGGLAGSFVAAGAAMLWVRPAREWFATGRWTRPSPAEKVTGGSAASRRTPLGGRGPSGGPGPPDQAGPPTTPPSAPGPPTTPPPAARPFGEHRPPEPAWVAGAATDRTAPPAPVQHHQQHLHERPGAMVAAFVITVVTAGGLLTLSLLWLAIAGLSPEFLRSVLEQQQPDMFDEAMTFQQVRETVLAYAGAFVVWCVVALVLAGFAMARRDWARRGLMVIAAFSAGGCLAFVATTPLVVIPAAAGIATVVCLRRIEVRRWFSPPTH